MSSINRFSIREWLVPPILLPILFVLLAASAFAPVKRPMSSLFDELNIRATTALDEARVIPPGVRRAKAMNKAMILRNAVEPHEHFLGKGRAPAR
jgi:hypothetical protein